MAQSLASAYENETDMDVEKKKYFSQSVGCWDGQTWHFFLAYIARARAEHAKMRKSELGTSTHQGRKGWRE
uniref:Uncharacterized protein n=1 Tax=Candidozyma auris TaxID=498019 RepID=A0A0L0NQE6_CANAR